MKFMHRKFMESSAQIEPIQHNYSKETGYRRRYFFYQALIWIIIVTVLFVVLKFFKVNH